MTVADAPTAVLPAVPAPTVGPAPAGDPARPDRYTGTHRANRGGRHRAGAVRPVDAGHGLTPAARQLVTGTDDAVPAGPDDATGLYELADVDRREETYDLAGLRDLLGDPGAPALAVEQAMADAGCTTTAPEETETR